MIGVNVDGFFRNFYYHFGLFLYKFRVLAIFLPFLLTGLFAIGYRNLDKYMINDHETIFSPLHSRWKREKSAFNRRFPLQDSHFYPGKSFESLEWIDLIVSVKEDREDRDILNYLPEVEKLEEHIYSNISVKASKHTNSEGEFVEQEYFYVHLCVRDSPKGCFSNKNTIDLFSNHSSRWDALQNSNESFLVDYLRGIITNEITVLYPQSVESRLSYPQEVYVGSVVGGVEVLGSDSSALSNHSLPIRSARSIRLSFTLLQDEINREISIAWKAKLQDFILSGGLEGQNLRFALYHRDTISQGMVDMARVLVPVFSCTVIVLTAFATLCSLLFLPSPPAPRLSPDWARSKPWLAFIGVMTAGMGVISCHGLLLSCGLMYTHIISVVPFLIVSIGVDDMFIMTAAWHRTKREWGTGERLGKCMSDAAVSITITSLTDFLSFAVGCSTNLPAIRAFCAYCAVAILFNYLYQVTFFAAWMGVFGDFEADGRHCVLPCFKVVPYNPKDSFFTRVFFSGTINRKSRSAEEPKVPDVESRSGMTGLTPKFFREYYGPFLTHSLTQVGVVLLYIAYLSGAIYGCLFVQEGLDVRGLVRKSFYVIDYADDMEETFFKQGEQLHVLVENPPDLAVAEEREKLEEVVQAFCDTPHSMSRLFVSFWLDGFMQHIQILENRNKSYNFYDEIRQSWMKTVERRESFKMDMTWEDPSNESSPGFLNLTSLRFMVGLKNYRNPDEHKRATTLFRQIADSFPQYSISTYHGFYPYADWYILLLPTSLRNIGIAIVAMMIVALFLIPNIPGAIIVTLAVVSIDIGVMGFMTHWNVKLDCISAMTIVMSIGFAVDLTAHISYAFITTSGTPRERAIHSLECLGVPILQGGVSTIIGMLILLSVDAAMMVVFVKTVFLSIFFGLVHSLIFIPVVLQILHPCLARFDSPHLKSKETTKSDGPVQPKAPINSSLNSNINEKWASAPNGKMSSGELHPEDPHLTGSKLSEKNTESSDSSGPIVNSRIHPKSGKYESRI